MINGFLDGLPDLGLDQYSRRKGIIRRRSIPAKPHFPKPRFVDYPAVRQKLVVALIDSETRRKWQAAIKRVFKEVRDYDQKWADNPFPIEWLKNNLPQSIRKSQFDKVSEQEYGRWRRIIKEQTGLSVRQGSGEALKIFEKKQAKYWEEHRIFYIWEAEKISRLVDDEDLLCTVLALYHDHVEVAEKVVTDEIRNMDADTYKNLVNFAGQLDQAKYETIVIYAEAKKLFRKGGSTRRQSKSRKKKPPQLPKETRERQATDVEGKDDISWQAKAIALLLDHRDWSITKVARKVGKSRKTLYDDPQVSVAIKARSKQKKAQSVLPAGKKNEKTGELEAW